MNSSFNTTISGYNPSGGFGIELKIHKDHLGLIIGKGWRNIIDLEKTHFVKIIVPSIFNSNTGNTDNSIFRKIMIVGTDSGFVRKACDVIMNLARFAEKRKTRVVNMEILNDYRLKNVDLYWVNISMPWRVFNTIVQNGEKKIESIFRGINVITRIFGEDTHTPLILMTAFSKQDIELVQKRLSVYCSSLCFPDKLELAPIPTYHKKKK